MDRAAGRCRQQSRQDEGDTMSDNRLRRRNCAAVLLALVFVVAGCGKQASESSPKTEPAKAPPDKVLVVGKDAAYAPLESQYEKGEIVGFGIDMMRAFRE